MALPAGGASAGPGGGGGGGAGGGGGREQALDLVVMENSFYDLGVSRIYDLKGSERNRFNPNAAMNPQARSQLLKGSRRTLTAVVSSSGHPQGAHTLQLAVRPHCSRFMVQCNRHARCMRVLAPTECSLL